MVHGREIKSDGYDVNNMCSEICPTLESAAKALGRFGVSEKCDFISVDAIIGAETALEMISVLHQLPDFCLDAFERRPGAILVGKHLLQHTNLNQLHLLVEGYYTIPGTDYYCWLSNDMLQAVVAAGN